MNIGIFSDTYVPQLNGVATSTQTLANALREKGHNVYVFTPSDPRIAGDDEANTYRIPSMPFVFVRNYRAGMFFSPLLLRKIRKLNLDMVHTQTEFTLGLLGKLISTTHGIPMIHTYHTMYEDYVHYIGGGNILTPEFARDFSKMFCNASMRIIAPTKKTETLLRSYGVTKPISIIPTGVNINHFRKENYAPEEIVALRKELGLEADTPVILSLGRVAKEKSIDIIIAALPKLLQKLPEAKMLIVGEGMILDELQTYADELGVSEYVIFTGGKPWAQIGKYYQLGNLFCSASVSETQGLTFAESMAAGVPVVAKKDECIENIITHNETGMLFEDEEELSELLYRVLTDSQLQKRLSDTARKSIELLSVETFCDSVESLYMDISENETPPQRISAPAIPLIVGATAAKGIIRIPKFILRKSIKYSKQVSEKIRSANKN